MWFDRLLDKSILFAFNRSGFLRHQRRFSSTPLHGKGLTALVTGASRGIGKAIKEKLEDCGVVVHAVSRSYNGQHLEQHKLDLSSQKDIDAFAKNINTTFDIVIHNAGLMPDSLILNKDRQELGWAVQVIGSYVLTRDLDKKNKLREGARIITVASGGIYLKKLDLDLSHEPYNKHSAYANAKRAQVILNEVLADENPEYFFAAMHPGWVDTGGLKQSMPTFYRWMENHLRTTEEGADTVVWLALTKNKLASGKFWFDRKEAPLHLFRWTKETREEQTQLLQLMRRYELAD